MNTTRRLIALSLCVLLAAGALSGCGGTNNANNNGNPNNLNSPDNNGDAGNALKIEVVSKGFQVDFWKMVNKGCNEAGAAYGASINFVGPASEANISEQIEQLSNAINKAPDAICFAPLDQDASMDLIAQAGGAGIPLITFDANIEADTGGAVLAFVATDNVAAGAHAADKMFEKLKNKLTNPTAPVRIGVMAQDTTSKSVAQRTKGFIDRMVTLCGADISSVEGHDMYNAKRENAKVILDVGIPAETTDAAGNVAAQTLLNKSDLIGLYGSNEFSAKAIVNVNESLQKLGPDGVCAIGFDSGAIQVQAVRDGILYGAITQDPVKIGYTVVDTAIRAARGESVSDVSVPFHFYDASNVDDPNVASCLYE
ncbi:MAG: substrate-binding domain-containing protein [Oscillospiraceae bacterium]|jgi:ribose transport system substrate-binding protein|nr:substrate-binding domain-containing protein [Oscillospiraceae bacterium]